MPLPLHQLPCTANLTSYRMLLIFDCRAFQQSAPSICKNMPHQICEDKGYSLKRQWNQFRGKIHRQEITDNENTTSSTAQKHDY